MTYKRRGSLIHSMNKHGIINTMNRIHQYRFLIRFQMILIEIYKMFWRDRIMSKRDKTYKNDCKSIFYKDNFHMYYLNK